MNKTIKTFAAAVLVAYFTLANLFAANLSVTMTAAGYTNLFLAQSPAQTNRGGGITLLTIANPNTSALNIRLFDSPSTNFQFAFATYTNITRSTVQITNIYTDPLSASVTNIYTGVTNTQATVSGATINYRTINFLTISSNSTFTAAYSSPNLFNLGLEITNSAACTISVDYIPF